MNKNNVFIISLLLSAVIAVIIVKHVKSSAKVEDMVYATNADTVGEITQLPRLLELGSVTCVPCKMMAPILDEVKNAYNGQLIVDFVDVAKNRNAGERYGISIIPTQIFFDANGKELYRHEGFISLKDIMHKWKEFGFEFESSNPISE